MRNQTINKYAHLEYEVLHRLDITIPEYWLLEMVYQLSRDGWCYKSLSNIAVDMKMSKRGVMKMRDRLIERKLIKKNIKGHLKTEVAYNSVHQLDKQAYNSVPKSVNSVHRGGELSATKNNNEINKDYKEDLSIAEATKDRIAQMLGVYRKEESRG